MPVPSQPAKDPAGLGGVDPLVASCTLEDVSGFLVAVQACLDRGGYSRARQELRRLAEASAGDAFGLFALRCLVAIAASGKQAQAAFLMAELGPSTTSATGDAEGTALGAKGELIVQELCGTSSGLKLAVKVLQSWHVSEAGCLGATLRSALAAAVLREALGGAAAAAAAALGAYPTLLDVEKSRTVLGAIDDGNRDDVAERLAANLGRECQLWFVRRRQTLGRLKATARSVKALGLQADFPDAEFAWRSQALKGSLEHGNRAAAVGLSFGEPRLYEACVFGLYDAGEPELAAELAGAWGVAVAPEIALAGAEAASKRMSAFLCAPEGFRVHIVDSESAVHNMRAALLGVPAIGIDAEWTPVETSQACLLQLATSVAAYLVDLLALASSEALAEALNAVLATSSVAKVGFDGSNDLSRVTRSLLAPCPQARTGALVDVRDMEAMRLGQPKKQAREGLSLSILAERHLGKPLNKSLQVCDWSRRPLSPAQERYAALDAWVPLRVYELLTAATRG